MNEATPIAALLAKARGFTISIGNMNGTERNATPNGAYGEDYNKLLSAAKKARPDLVDLLPPQVTVFTHSDLGARYTEESFAEINTYCEQIFQMLSE